MSAGFLFQISLIVIYDVRTVGERLIQVKRQAGSLRHWSAVRLCSSLLFQLVDSISPFITTVLVHGKLLAVGVVGGQEVVIDKPLTPSEIHVSNLPHFALDSITVSFPIVDLLI